MNLMFSLYKVEQCANSFGLSVSDISDSIINEIIQSTGSKFGMRAYKQLINRKFGKKFSSCSPSDAVAISGSLDALEISP